MVGPGGSNGGSDDNNNGGDDGGANRAAAAAGEDDDDSSTTIIVVVVLVLLFLACIFIVVLLRRKDDNEITAVMGQSFVNRMYEAGDDDNNDGEMYDGAQNSKVGTITKRNRGSIQIKPENSAKLYDIPMDLSESSTDGPSSVVVAQENGGQPTYALLPTSACVRASFLQRGPLSPLSRSHSLHRCLWLSIPLPHTPTRSLAVFSCAHAAFIVSHRAATSTLRPWTITARTHPATRRSR